MEEVDNVLRILTETKKFLIEDRPYELKTLSNQTIHTAAVSQDPDNIIVAVLVYSLSKVLERDKYREMEGYGEFYSAVTKNLESAISSLEKNDVDACRTYLGKIRNSLNKISSDLNRYIKDVFIKAEINKAFKLYEHGISIEKTAELLGVSLWELSSYIGQSTVSEARIAICMPVKERIKIAEDFFK
jgi:hypothetical protein